MAEFNNVLMAALHILHTFHAPIYGIQFLCCHLSINHVPNSPSAAIFIVYLHSNYLSLVVRGLMESAST